MRETEKKTVYNINDGDGDGQEWRSVAAALLNRMAYIFPFHQKCVVFFLLVLFLFSECSANVFGVGTKVSVHFGGLKEGK